MLSLRCRGVISESTVTGNSVCGEINVMLSETLKKNH